MNDKQRTQEAGYQKHSRPPTEGVFWHINRLVVLWDKQDTIQQYVVYV